MRVDPERARRWFTASPVARMASADPRQPAEPPAPHVVPVTFAALGDEIVTAVDHKPKSDRRLRRLRILERNPSVALLADHYEADWARLWWVRADGAATVLPADRRPDLVEALSAKYAQYRQHPPQAELIVVTVGSWSGWAAGEF